jgi:hypothetical protein
MPLPQLETQTGVGTTLYEMSKLGEERKRTKLMERRLTLAEKEAETQHEINLLRLSSEYLKRVKNKQDLKEVANTLITRHGMNPQLWPDPNSFETDEEATEWAMKQGMTAAEWANYKKGDPITLSFDKGDGTYKTLTTKDPATIQKLVNRGWEIGKLTGTKRKSLEEIKAETRAKETVKEEIRGRKPRAVKAYLTPENTVEYLPNNEIPPKGWVPYKPGIEFEATPEGGVSFTTTALPTRKGQGGMTKRTQGAIEEKLFNVSENLARLEEISQLYKPEFLKTKTALSALKTRWGEKTDLWEPSEQEKKQLAEFSAFKRSAINNINLYIKEITGAQMSEREADRIRKGMPDPGEGLFDGDSPTEFEAKWKDTVHSLRMAQARYIRYLRNGLTPKEATELIKKGNAISLRDIEKEINEWGKRSYAKLKTANPEMSEIELQRIVKEQIRKQFFSVDGL